MKECNLYGRIEELMNFVPEDLCGEIIEKAIKKEYEALKNDPEVISALREKVQFQAELEGFTLTEAEIDEATAEFLKEINTPSADQEAEQKQRRKQEIEETAGTLVSRWLEIIFSMSIRNKDAFLRLDENLLPPAHEELFKKNEYESWFDDFSYYLSGLIEEEDAPRLYQAFTSHLREEINKNLDGYEVWLDTSIKKDEDGYVLIKGGE